MPGKCTTSQPSGTPLSTQMLSLCPHRLTSCSSNCWFCCEELPAFPTILRCHVSLPSGLSTALCARAFHDFALALLCRKRQLEEELLAAQYSSGGVPAAPALLSTDPITQKVLASVLGSLDDRSNRWGDGKVLRLSALAAGAKVFCEVGFSFGKIADSAQSRCWCFEVHDTKFDGLHLLVGQALCDGLLNSCDVLL